MDQHEHLQQAKNATAALKRHTLKDKPVVEQLDPGNLNPLEYLPMHHMTDNVNWEVKQFVEVITDIEGPIDKKVLEKICWENRLGDLPEPFSLVASPQMNFKIQFALWSKRMANTVC